MSSIQILRDGGMEDAAMVSFNMSFVYRQTLLLVPVWPGRSRTGYHFPSDAGQQAGLASGRKGTERALVERSTLNTQ